MSNLQVLHDGRAMGHDIPILDPVMAPKPNGSFRVFTIGHSTRTLEEFVALLKAHKIGRLVDIRSIPLGATLLSAAMRITCKRRRLRKRSTSCRERSRRARNRGP